MQVSLSCLIMSDAVIHICEPRGRGKLKELWWISIPFETLGIRYCARICLGPAMCAISDDDDDDDQDFILCAHFAIFVSCLH